MDAEEGLSFEDYLENSSEDDIEKFEDKFVEGIEEVGGNENSVPISEVQQVESESIGFQTSGREEHVNEHVNPRE